MLNKNRVLFSNRPKLLKKISEAEAEYHIRFSKDNSPVPVRNTDGVWLSSRYSPCKEAERWIEEEKFEESDLPLILGFSPIVIEKLNYERIVVVENDTSLIKAYFESTEFSEKMKNVTLIIDDEGFDAGMALRNEFNAFNHLRIKLSVLPFKQNSENQLWIKKMAETALQVQREESLNSLSYAYQLPLWTKTAAQNLKYWINSPHPYLLEKYYSGGTALIVCAGPSLEKNIELIPHFKGKALVIAVDTALRRLDKAGIIPDIVVSIDANEQNAKDVKGLSKAILNTLLIADYITSPAIIKAFTGPKIFLRSINYTIDLEGKTYPILQPLDKIILEITGRKILPSWQSGGSVSSNAFSLAGILGTRRIIFAGQDLAFSGGRTHTRGVGYEEEWCEKTDRFSSREFTERTALRKGRVAVEGWNGSAVYTSDTMREYAKWFELTIKRGFASALEVIDATEGGAKKYGMKNMKLSEALLLCKNEKVEIKELLFQLQKCEPLGTDGSNNRLRNLIDHLIQIKDDPDALIEKCPLTKWLSLPAYIGGKDFSKSDRTILIRNTVLSAGEFLLKTADNELEL